MDEAIESILRELREGEEPDDLWLDKLLRRLSASQPNPSRRLAKKRLLPYYLAQKAGNTTQWQRWAITESEDDAIIALLRAKPRRTASGVATITVLMKPWPCASDCLYCPNDIRMPKSYLSDEPACQRAERCWFDPYLQVASRMSVLADMGHNVDKVELIVLGGTFSDYPESYRTWFIEELFRALNDFGSPELAKNVDARKALYESSGLPRSQDEISAQRACAQERVNAGKSSYNADVSAINADLPDQILELEHSASLTDLLREQERNESAKSRNVGLVVETRPDLITRDHLRHLRELGCTKIQMGIQSLSPDILSANTRGATIESIDKAFSLLREFGFKSHVHFMVNLLGGNPEGDKVGYKTLVSDPRYMPDEIKLYPCALVESAKLMRFYEEGKWVPYTEDELMDVLSSSLKATPPFTRISRMIRDISSKDIVVGNKKANLRQMVEDSVPSDKVCEMRIRETGTNDVDFGDLSMEEVAYETSNTNERFLQWVTDDGKLAAFLRLSLPKSHAEFAMIREVHVYGRVSKLHEQKEGAQHSGLGKALIERACEIAEELGYGKIKVISAIGTRNYYRHLGFFDEKLYLSKLLQPSGNKSCFDG